MIAPIIPQTSNCTESHRQVTFVTNGSSSRFPVSCISSLVRVLRMPHPHVSADMIKQMERLLRRPLTPEEIRLLTLSEEVRHTDDTREDDQVAS